MKTIILYPRCSTCIKARKHLESMNIEFKERHIVEDSLSKEELKQLFQNSDYPLKKFFNTSGMKYKELGLKDKLKDMSEDEQLELLASDGMLVKRPLFIDGNQLIIGYKKEIYEEIIK